MHKMDDAARMSKDVGEYRVVQELDGHDRPVASVRWCRGGKLMISTSADGLGLIWRQKEDNYQMKCVQKLAGAHREGLNEAAWSRDSVWCATASDDKTCRLWDVERGAAVVNLEGHESYVFCVDIHPLSGLVVTGSFDESYRLWDPRTGKCVKAVEAHSDPVTGTRFDAPKASTLITTSFDGLVRLWDVRTGSCVATMFTDSSDLPRRTRKKTAASHTSLYIKEEDNTKNFKLPAPPKKATRYAPVSHVQLAPNGVFALTAHHDSALRLWNIASAPCRRIRTYHEERFINTRYCGACVFHAKCLSRRNHYDRHLVAAGSEDGRLLLWNLQSAKLEYDIPNAHDGDAILAIDSHPIHDLLATAGGRNSNFSIKLWAWNQTISSPQHETQSLPSTDDQYTHQPLTNGSLPSQKRASSLEHINQLPKDPEQTSHTSKVEEEPPTDQGIQSPAILMDTSS